MIDVFAANESLAFYVSYVLVALIVFVTSFAGLTVRNKRLRTTTLTVFFMVFLGVSYIAIGELLGRAKPISLAIWNRPNVEEATVVGFYLVEGKSINILLIYDGIEEPRYYKFPWHKKSALKLQRGKQSQDSEEIKGMKLRLPFQRSWDDDKFPDIHEIPWPKPPGKNERLDEIIDLNNMKA